MLKTLLPLLVCSGLAGAQAIQPLPASAPAAGQAASQPLLNDLKIVYFGSSVPFGQGATNK